MAKSKKTKKEEPVVTQEQLQAVAEDFNSFMVEEGEEGIDTELEYDDLLAEVTEAAGDLVDDDVITQETAGTLEALGIDHVAQVEEEDDDSDPEDNVDEEEEEEEEEEEADPDGESIEEMIERAKKNKIPVPPNFRKDKEKLAAYLEKKMPAAPAKATGKKGAKAETKPAEKKGGKPAEKKGGKPAAAPKEKKALKKTPGGPGVISTIREAIKGSGKKGISKEAILDKLTKTFPDRDPDAMKKTINVQVPNRISKESFSVEKTKDGNFRAA